MKGIRFIRVGQLPVPVPDHFPEVQVECLALATQPGWTRHRLWCDFGDLVVEAPCEAWGVEIEAGPTSREICNVILAWLEEMGRAPDPPDWRLASMPEDYYA